MTDPTREAEIRRVRAECAASVGSRGIDWEADWLAARVVDQAKDADRLARYLLRDGDFFDYSEYDPMDAEEALIDAGYLERGTVTEADIDDGWPAEWDLDVGDGCTKYTEKAKRAMGWAKEPSDD